MALRVEMPSLGNMLRKRKAKKPKNPLQHHHSAQNVSKMSRKERSCKFLQFYWCSSESTNKKKSKTRKRVLQ